MGILYKWGEKYVKKPYSLNYDIQRDTDRVAAVTSILDKLEKDPSPTELEQMGTYILCGKDEEGFNAFQRGEITLGDRRYASYRKKDDKLVSLDNILENPLADQQSLKTLTTKDHAIKPKPSITRPRYDKKTGALIDIGDGDIPGMQELWDSIDRLEKWIAALKGEIAPDENMEMFDNGYRLYQLKHNLIDMRRQQYYLRDAYKPTLHFAQADKPRARFIDWSSDATYWMPLDEWQRKVDNSLLSSVSKKLSDYETRENPKTHKTEVRWVVRRHTFNWEDPQHIAAFIANYDLLYDQLYDKLETYGNTLLFDFDFYHKQANLSEVREFILNKKLERAPYCEITHQLQLKFGLTYNENHISEIVAREIPEKIAFAATKYRLTIETPQERMKKCFRCGKTFPRHALFFSRNRGRRDGYSSNCKDCEKLRRINKGDQTAYDRRSKEATLYKVQTGET